MERFEICKVKIIEDDTGRYTGEWIAIKDNDELFNGGDQPFGIINTPIDARELFSLLDKANYENSAYCIIDCCDWVSTDETVCEEV